MMLHTVATATRGSAWGCRRCRRRATRWAADDAGALLMEAEVAGEAP